MSNLNIEYCCTCLKVCSEQDKFLSLGFFSSQQVTYRKKLKFCVPEMGPEIDVDSYMCKPCSIALEQAYTFRCMCIRTEGMLNSFRVKGNLKDGNGIKKDLIQLLLTQNNTDLLPKLNRSLSNSHSVVNIDEHNSVEIIRELGSLLSESLSNTKNEIEISRLSRPKNEIDLSRLSNSKKEIELLSLSETKKKIESPNLSDIEQNIESTSLPSTRSRTETSSVSDTKKKIETPSVSDTKKQIGTSSLSGTRGRRETSSLPDVKRRLETSSPYNTRRNIESPSVITKRETETSKIKVKKRPASPPLPQAKRRCLTDDEIITLSCKTDPELRNVSPQELKCQVTLEKLTITELPVIIPSRPSNTRASKQQKEFPCNKCGKVLKKKEYYYSHILKHSNIRAFRCKLCPSAYFSADALRTHKRRQHPNNVPPTTTANEVKPKIESAQKTVPKPKPVTPRSNKNARGKTDEGQEVFNCLYCAFQTSSKPIFTQHVTLHTVRGKYPCPHCRKNFIPFWGLSKHVREMHAKTNSSPPKKQITKALPIIIKSEPVTEPEPQCEEPPKLPACVKQESKNIETNHDASVPPVKKRKKYFCPQCNSEFSSRDHANIHTGEKPYTCAICLKKFGAYTTLRVHRKIHAKNSSANDVSTPPVVHKCDICKQTFNNSYDATSHTCQTSTGESVYRCQICKNAYLGRNALVDHMRMHLEETD
uniref:C2H2-type domain-containing protein n=1 Tax=Photinus pyralis TaxID=7054 RepID=A0A1Y1L8G3_PHOPY